jgi:hypothetical protein
MFGVILVAKPLSLGRRYSVPVSILLTWLAAEISFVYFESRFLRMRNRFWPEPRHTDPNMAAPQLEAAAVTAMGAIDPDSTAGHYSPPVSTDS